MAKIWCCRRFQDAQVFKITPTRLNILEEFVLYVHCCSCCKQQVIEILRADINENILKPVRLNSKNIPDFIRKMDVLWKPRKTFFHKSKISRFVLNYNEFGKIRHCTENISRLNMGRIETDPILNLKTYKRHKQSFVVWKFTQVFRGFLWIYLRVFSYIRTFFPFSHQCFLFFLIQLHSSMWWISKQWIKVVIWIMTLRLDQQPLIFLLEDMFLYIFYIIKSVLTIFFVLFIKYLNITLYINFRHKKRELFLSC